MRRPKDSKTFPLGRPVTRSMSCISGIPRLLHQLPSQVLTGNRQAVIEVNILWPMEMPQQRTSCDVCWASVPTPLMYFHRAWHDELAESLERASRLDMRRGKRPNPDRSFADSVVE